MKKNCNKGFTLIEVIVVLVILAILASTVIPAMTGWIDRAKEKRLIVACRTCVNAAQTIAVEQYGLSGAAGVNVTPADTLALAGLTGSVDGIKIVDNATVDALTYADGSGDSVTYERLPSPHFTFGAGSGGSTQKLSIADLSTADTLNELLAPFPKTTGMINSEATGITGTEAEAALAKLKENGIDLSDMGMTTWQYYSKSGQQFLYWTDYSIADMNVGTNIIAMRYNFNTHTYTLWNATVAENKNYNGGSEPFKTINVRGNSSIAMKDEQGNRLPETYENMIAQYKEKTAALGIDTGSGT